MLKDPSKLTYPRHLAIRVLTKVLSDYQPLDEAFASVTGDVQPEVLGWLQEICSGTLRWKGRLDQIIDSVSLRKKPSGWLRKALLLGAYQLVVQDRVNAGSVVSETVSLVKGKEGESPARFANACLRKISDHAGSWRNIPFDPGMSLSESSHWASMPEWLWEKLLKQHGQDWAVAYAQASLERPTLWIRCRDVAEKLSWATPGVIPNSWNITEGGRITEKPGFGEGKWIVQDISSQKLIYDVTQKVRQDLPNQGLKALDVCAAPGGKSIGLSWNGFQVTATDRMEPRVLLLKENVHRVAQDIQVIGWQELDRVTSQNLVWVDAPCTGTGILRRHPDVRWLRKEKELSSLNQTQTELIRQGWDKVTPGGFLVYSVCSVLKEEGPEAILRSDLERFKIQHWFLGPQNTPHGDGFWAALLKKPLT